LLPPLSTKVKHFEAVAVAEIPSFAAELMARTSVSAKALLFTLVTACRTGDCIGAKWNEIDLSAKLWSMPEGRTKAGRPFRIPLSDAAIAILEVLPRRDGYLFSAGTAGKPLSNMAMLKLMRDMRGHGSTVQACEVHSATGQARQANGTRWSRWRSTIGGAMPFILHMRDPI
jgi:integrase